MTARAALLIGNSYISDICSHLIDSGFVVESADSTLDVAVHAMETKFAIAFVELDLPKSDLFDRVNRLRRTSNNRRTPLIGLISERQKDKEDGVSCLRTSICDYLMLPVVPAQLELVVRRWID